MDIAAFDVISSHHPGKAHWCLAVADMAALRARDDALGEGIAVADDEVVLHKVELLDGHAVQGKPFLVVLANEAALAHR